MHATLPHLDQHDFPVMRRRAVSTVQVNIGYYCNQACLHCHVNAGPTRKEKMDHETAKQIVAYLDASDVGTLDITGGAPELHAEFRYLVEAARSRGIHVIDRCNLTVLELPEMDGLAEFLAENGVEVVASLPCYSSENVDKQRGSGVFDASIKGLQRLNALGYAQPGSGLTLNLVFNPIGPVLPPDQEALTADYRERLWNDFGIEFDQLLCLANLPIHRFGSTLISKGQFNDYVELLKSSHKDANMEHVMCRDMISIDWQGYVYDCDFNQMLDLPQGGRGKPKRHITDLIGHSLEGAPIAVSGHCYGCTAGQGSSCGGALA
jgi:radical SAM/Cys-rich protein